MLCLAFVCQSLQRGCSGLGCMICHNEGTLRSVHVATLRSIKIFGDVIAVKDAPAEVYSRRDDDLESYQQRSGLLSLGGASAAVG
jgi:hypothetical protein